MGHQIKSRIDKDLEEACEPASPAASPDDEKESDGAKPRANEDSTLVALAGAPGRGKNQVPSSLALKPYLVSASRRTSW